MQASDSNDLATHACRNLDCRRPISNRFTFTLCVRCSLDTLHEVLKADGYYERQAARIARREEEEAAERLRARGVLRKESLK
jgi:hypothetical protein